MRRQIKVNPQRERITSNFQNESLGVNLGNIGFRVMGLGFRVWGLGFCIYIYIYVYVYSISSYRTCLTLYGGSEKKGVPFLVWGGGVPIRIWDLY